MDLHTPHIPPPGIPAYPQSAQQVPSGNGQVPSATPQQAQAAPHIPDSGAVPAQPLALQSDPASTHIASPPTPETGMGVSDVDKEWVEKAKNIVWQTRNDPHTQSSEVSKLKAEYLRVRFDRQSNVAEENKT